MSAYYLKQAVKNWSLSSIYRGMADFMVIQVICVVLVVAFPQIAMWFPNWLTKGDRLNASEVAPATQVVETQPALEAGDFKPLDASR